MYISFLEYHIAPSIVNGIRKEDFDILHIHGWRNFTSDIGFLIGIPTILKILLKEKTDIVISTGAEIAISVFYVAKLLRIKTIFIESWCRVNKPSITGKIVYPIADVFCTPMETAIKEIWWKSKIRGWCILIFVTIGLHYQGFERLV